MICANLCLQLLQLLFLMIPGIAMGIFSDYFQDPNREIWVGLLLSVGFFVIMVGCRTPPLDRMQLYSIMYGRTLAFIRCSLTSLAHAVSNA